MASRDVALERGLPANESAERLVLGAILTDESAFVQVAGSIEADDFSLEKHRRIFLRMRELNDRAEKIDRITVANELMRAGQLESVDGIGYLVSLDDGLPRLYHLDEYVRIVKEKATLRQLIYSCQKIIDVSMLGQEDSASILASAEETLLGISEASARNTLANPGEIIDEFQGGLSAFLDPSQRIKGVSTGFVEFDRMTGGLHPGELIILAARPSMGKTALALNVAQHVAAHPQIKRPVAVFSLEMSKEALLTRMICAAARVDQQKFRLGYLDKQERRRLQMAAAELAEAPLYIDDTAGANLMDIHAKVRQLKAQQKDLALVVVDYLQLMSGGGRFENRNQEVSYLSRGFKLLSKELEVPMLVLSQLNRNPEQRGRDAIPQLSDLRESGSIEQDADLVAFIYREEYYRPTETNKGMAQVIVGKQRNGPIGRIDLAFLKQFTKFENLASQLDNDQEPAPDDDEPFD